LKLIIYVVLVYIFYRLVRAAFRSNRKIQRDRQDPVIDEMVQDPFCKTYIPLRQSVKRVIDGEEHFFCSPECAGRFLSERKRT
jgi:YHS domain-containing protein